MTRIAALVVTLLLAGGVAPAYAQDACRLVCAPSFVAQPGVAVTGIRESARAEGEDVAVDFVFQLSTVVPTGHSRLNFLGLLGWAPYARTDGFTDNAPYFVYGPLFTVLDRGPLEVTFDVLGAYGPASGADRSYEHQFGLEVDVALDIGAWLPPAAPAYMREVGLYAFFFQQMTGLDRDIAGKKVYSPEIYVGLTLPIAPLP